MPPPKCAGNVDVPGLGLKDTIQVKVQLLKFFYLNTKSSSIKNFKKYLQEEL